MNCELSFEGYIIILTLVRRKIKEYVLNNLVEIVAPFKEVQIDATHWVKKEIR